MHGILIVLVVVACGFLLKVAIGFFAPKASGKQLLKQNLQKYGVPPGNLPENFIIETVDHCWRTAEGMSGLGVAESKTTCFVDMLEGEAVNIATILLDKKDVGLSPDRPSIAFERLQKYNLIQ